MAYQDELVRNFIAQPWRSMDHPRYRLPIPQEQYMRCWGSASPADAEEGHAHDGATGGRGRLALALGQLLEGGVRRSR